MRDHDQDAAVSEARRKVSARRVERGIGPPPGLWPWGTRARERREAHAAARAVIRRKQARLRERALDGIGDRLETERPWPPQARWQPVSRARNLLVIAAMVAVLAGIVVLGMPSSTGGLW